MVTVDLEMNRLKFFRACQLTMCAAKKPLYALYSEESQEANK